MDVSEVTSASDLRNMALIYFKRVNYIQQTMYTVLILNKKMEE